MPCRLKIFMQKFKIYLRTESEEGAECFSADAEARGEEGGTTFLFSGEDCAYRVHIGGSAYIERSGDIAYKLCLTEKASVCIRTAYGNIFAEVLPESFFAENRGDQCFLETVYVLKFPNFSQRHKIIFKAKACGAPAADKDRI